MQHTLRNVQKISLIFFIVIGFAHIISNMLIADQLYLSLSHLIGRILDIPFIVTGLLYGFSSLRLALANDDKKHTILDTTLAIIACIIFLAAVIINIFFKDLPS